MAVASYTLAVQRDFKNKDGEYEADFIRCKAFGKRGEFVEKYLHKGMKIIAEGRLQSGTYEKDGQTHYTTDLIVDRHEFCESKKGGEQGQQPQQDYDVPEGFQAVSDDDIPF
nr:MAG TPA: Single strand binding protein [Caudoviricetes sp.]